MPKNNDIIKSKSKSKSTRKPLRDVSNGVKSTKKKPPEAEDRVGDDALDRLLLVHSDLSSLLHQIDELVVQALKFKVTNKKGREEIESFAHLLSDMHTSLEPWVPRFQKALACPSTGSENQSEHSLAGKKTLPAADDDKSNVVDSPYQTKLDSLVSPSPLVSWRADCTTESGRQLFLLTPLPRAKASSFKFQGPSKSVFENITSDNTVGLPSLLALSGHTDDDLLESVVIKLTPSKVPDSVVTKNETAMQSGFVSPAKFSQRDCSMFVMTPRLKMSPPKSCVLLEPISEISHKDVHGVHKSTPFPVGVQNLSGSRDSESSSNQVSEHLVLKYPELFGIKAANKLANRRTVVEESPNWFMSPPKTCILMEPPDENLLTNAATKCQVPRTAFVINQRTYLPSMKEKNNQDSQLPTKKSCKQAGGGSKIIESTPMWKEPESIVRAGKRPGENTLKKELWTKFEAASTHAIRFNVSVLEETSHRGFLDLLDEACCEERSQGPEGLR
ncbi:unnamed protein product [Ilex paraguariensis]|uniref:Uncharacterized protein n=1 Tax=Ilex paraguariensis TaxID=185542 RepID=A0ABC8R4E3_9AQUA